MFFKYSSLGKFTFAIDMQFSSSSFRLLQQTVQADTITFIPNNLIEFSEVNEFKSSN